LKIEKKPSFLKNAEKANPRIEEEGKKINWRDGIIVIWTLLKYRWPKERVQVKRS